VGEATQSLNEQNATILPGILSPGIAWPCLDLARSPTHLLMLQRLGISGALSQLPHVTIWHA
jgi:hypothetical protein